MTETLRSPPNAAGNGNRLLVVDDEPDLRTLYELTLLREGYEIDTAGSVEEALQRLEEAAYGAVITDMRLPDGVGLDLLRWLDEQGRSERAVVITAYGSAENAVEALKAGAFDYLTKPVDLKQFRTVVASALGRSGAAPGAGAAQALAAMAGSAATATTARPRSLPAPVPASAALQRMAGGSEAMQQVRAMVHKVARSMAPVMVCGESGTGKELVARAIHEVSTRSAEPFVAVNCGAIPEQLLEAEFFGYRKGAFTGAAEDRAGFFQAAHGGTLFLDEIGELPLAMQSKLLRAVQERAVRPIGAVAESFVDVRLISATHKDLAREVQSGRFRQDLYYRLNVIQIRVPPLRERRADLGDIASQVLRRIAADAGIGPTPRLTAAALQHLAGHDFPGNVRELENLLYRAVAMSDGGDIDVGALGLPDQDAPPPGVPDTPLPRAAPASASPSAPASPLPATALPPGSASEPIASVASTALPDNLEAHLDAIERDILVRALERHRNNRTAAGASLGLSLRQMRYRMARLQIGVASEAGGEPDGQP